MFNSASELSPDATTASLRPATKTLRLAVIVNMRQVIFVEIFADLLHNFQMKLSKKDKLIGHIIAAVILYFLTYFVGPYFLTSDSRETILTILPMIATIITISAIVGWRSRARKDRR